MKTKVFTKTMEDENDESCMKHPASCTDDDPVSINDNSNCHTKAMTADEPEGIEATTSTLAKSNNNKNGNGYDKKNKRNIHYDNAYQGFVYEPIESTGQPGTPHSFFHSSYTVSFHNNEVNNNSSKQTRNGSTDKHMIVHRHVNGLVVVTAGNYFTNEIYHVEQINAETTTLENTENTSAIDVSHQKLAQHKMLSDIEFYVQMPSDSHQQGSSVDESPALESGSGGQLSANAKRKIQSKMLSGRNVKNNNGNNKHNSKMPRQHDKEAEDEAQQSQQKEQKSCSGVIETSAEVNNSTKNWIVRPSDSLVSVKVSKGVTHPSDENNYKDVILPCCVWGTIVEINPKLLYRLNETAIAAESRNAASNQQGQATVVNKHELISNASILLQTDPLLSGFLAIIEPTGPFPPSCPSMPDE
jgi:hypothetical protein